MTDTEPRLWGTIPGYDRTWHIYIYDEGRIQARDLMSPTGQTEWITVEQLNKANPQ